MNARKALTLATGLALALTLGACGGSDETTNCNTNPTGPGCPPPPPPTPPPPIVVAEGGGPIEFDAVARVPFDLSRAGALNGTVEWTFPTNSILVIVTRGACTFDQFFALECTIASLSQGTTPKPRTFSLAGQTAGPFTLFIGNLGPADESVRYQLVLNPSATSAAAAQEPVDLSKVDLRRFKHHVELR
jgi:hypothetical protein